MAWVQVGTHKINTAVICYIEQEGETVRVHFHGQWQGNPLELHFDEAKACWRHLKAEDVMMAKDKGSTAVLPKLGSAGSSSSSAYDFNARHSDDKEKSKAPTPHAPPQPHRHAEPKKH